MSLTEWSEPDIGIGSFQNLVHFDLVDQNGTFADSDSLLVRRREQESVQGKGRRQLRFNLLPIRGQFYF